MNYFSSPSVAERYAHARPYFHPLVVEKIAVFLEIEEPVEAALDVGCGTGHSAMALKPLARSIIGVDVSAEMLAMAPKDPQIRYLQSPAETIPLADHSIDLLTTAMALHWFDRPRFFREVRRLLKPEGWLVIYNNGFTGRMQENANFDLWHNSIFLRRYPTPPRSSYVADKDEVIACGLEHVYEDYYTNEVTFTLEEMAAYLTTQSNVIAVVEEGRESMEEAYRWLVNDLQSILPDTPTGTFPFRGSIGYLRPLENIFT